MNRLFGLFHKKIYLLWNGFYEQAFRPVPQENLSFVEGAGEPVLDNGAKCVIKNYFKLAAATLIGSSNSNGKCSIFNCVLSAAFLSGSGP